MRTDALAANPPLGANGAICGTNLTCTGAGCTPRNPNCTYSNGGYTNSTGTSMASPQVAGAIALLHSIASSDL